MITPFIEQTILLVLLFSGVPLLVSTGVSLAVSIIQAATQVQEQSISFLLKIGSLVTVLALASGYIVREMIAYFQGTLEAIKYLGV
ncbi:MAG: flagellar biosynthetic protein FliQ [Bdellovibrionales bacterium]|nr:flagellar biosynthetic protein FliQ [Bdellovibrionales bacterium]